MLERLAPGDRLIVSELSRLGRSLGQVIHIVDELVKRKIRFTAIKESIHFEGKQDLQTKVMVALFGLFAEVERDLISERTREGLASARAKGRLLGRPKGVLGKSRLDGKKEEIRLLLQKQVSKASIAKIVGVTRPRQGGYDLTLKGYFRTILGGTLGRAATSAALYNGNFRLLPPSPATLHESDELGQSAQLRGGVAAIGIRRINAAAMA